ncbi:tetratricopeptide repeat protein [Psychrobacillus sp. L4]|uniref:tetratricopeptide repeat protein n=1 Tax=Psychrobacillus sp. L4 TaxID=3236892 RepID=UPI0036F21B5A
MAIERLEKALKLSFENKQISNLIRLGEALKYDGQPEEALKKFEQVIDACMSNTNSMFLDFAYQHKGKCLLELGQMDIALDYFQEAMKLRLAKGDQSLIDSSQKAINHVKQAIWNRS